MSDIECLFDVAYLIELSLDGNPLSESDPTRYRYQVILGMPGLRHLDLKRITDEERLMAASQELGPSNGKLDQSEKWNESSIRSDDVQAGNQEKQFGTKFLFVVDKMHNLIRRCIHERKSR